MNVIIPGQPKPKTHKKRKSIVRNLVIPADEYCSVQKHGIINFINFISRVSVINMYIQNPPENIREQLYRVFDKSIIHEEHQHYLEVLKNMLRTFNSQYHSAFYQLFDEGIYEDHNYKVTVDKAIIVCTSNHKTVDEVKENLGLPIYNRFDPIIKFDELSNEAKKIAELEIQRLKTNYDIEDSKLFGKLKEATITASNAREIKHLVKDTFSLLAIRKICSDAEE